MTSAATLRRACLPLAALLATGFAVASTPPVSVGWTDPAAFAEVRENTCRSSSRPQEWLGELARYLQRRAGKVLGAGQHLDITITDIRRAGACEPWRGPQLDDVRVIKNLYSPRIDLRYALTDANGNVVRKGESRLRDAAFLSRGSMRRDDPLRYEKRMLNDWLRSKFPDAGAARR